MTDPHGLESPNSKFTAWKYWDFQELAPPETHACRGFCTVSNFEVQSDHSRLGIVLFKPSWPRIHPLADARRDAPAW